MKELSIRISDAYVDGFSYSMTSGSLLLYRRNSIEGETLSSVIERECQEQETRIKIIWNNRRSVLVPSSVFKIEEMTGYLRQITGFVRSPQCIQCGEFVAVWDVDTRLDEIRSVSEDLGLVVLHTHQRVEHIISTEDSSVKATLYDNLLYITDKSDTRLEGSYVAEVYTPEDVLYYLSLICNGEKTIFTTLPPNWTSLVSEYFQITPVI